jgi:hypothetical protein
MNVAKVKPVSKDELKEILDAKLDPIIKIVEDHETILRGQSKRNGIVGDVNKVKWLTGGGIFALVWKAYDFMASLK